MKAIFIVPAGNEVTVDVESGVSLMRAATAHGVDGIIADCGGSASCATCHVFVDEEYLKRLPIPSSNEEQMLDCTAADRKANSRLSCQIVMSENLEGIRVTVADPQL
ncbi:2Fe-2S iron-sulfur cluster binding domain-containing protein [Ochrobactrum sp. Q0168]|uniref:2Fe-2S iron-sulfur cluster-binding protein n=1 Tax=Ochrobactrum sp. Q0168 TaxID=2793241 RepID=UPI0018ED50B1|nr:2Fe-2S iron-sulfur cluster binding domain-containing protein [Ochrobactrum sp. Q0168]